MMKKTKIALCTLLTGTLAAGTYQGISLINDLNSPQNVEAAINDDNDETRLTLTKKSDSDDSESEEKAESSENVKGSLDVSDIAEEAMPSVVAITTESVQEVEEYYGSFGYYGFAPYGGSEEQEVEGSGSGIIIGKNDNELLIVTNYHVVEDADTVSVAFADGEACEASVKGFEQNKDLAVVSVKLEDIDDDTLDAISIAKIGSSDDLKVGEQVVAIGNAMGYGQSVTTGIVSAKNRMMDSNYGNVKTDDETSRTSVNLIQTDAAINPGNSGGALLNMDGELVGINSAKLASTEVEGMGYAIAISDVEDILENLMNEEPREKLDDSEHGVLGIMGSTVSEEGSTVYGIPEGVFVSEVTEGSAAEKAGIKKNTVITEFDGKSIASIDQLVDLLKYYAPGEEVDVTILVPTGDEYQEETVTVKLDKNTDVEEDEKEDSDSEESDSQDDGKEAEDFPKEGRTLEDFFDQWN